MMNPLPHLGARDLRRGRILHHPVKRNGTASAQPRLQVLNRDADIETEPRFRDGAARRLQQLVRAHFNVVSRAAELIVTSHVCRERLTGDGDEGRMRHPRAIVAIHGLSRLVGSHALLGNRVRLGIVLDRDLRGHSAHRKRSTTMTRANQQLRVRSHARLGHGDLRAIR
jgi:hypothetical protein